MPDFSPATDAWTLDIGSSVLPPLPPAQSLPELHLVSQIRARACVRATARVCNANKQKSALLT